MISERQLQLEPLNAAAFAPYGEVIAAGAALQRFAINGGSTERLHALARARADNGDVVISLALAQARSFPFEIAMLERHPHGSQAFVPLDQRPYIIVVASAPNHRPHAFLAMHGEGINFRAGTWHHPLIALRDGSQFLIVDRDGPGDNCDEVTLQPSWWLTAPA